MHCVGICDTLSMHPKGVSAVERQAVSYISAKEVRLCDLR